MLNITVKHNDSHELYDDNSDIYDSVQELLNSCEHEDLALQNENSIEYVDIWHLPENKRLTLSITKSKNDIFDIINISLTGDEVEGLSPIVENIKTKINTLALENSHIIE